MNRLVGVTDTDCLVNLRMDRNVMQMNEEKYKSDWTGNKELKELRTSEYKNSISNYYSKSVF